MGFFDFLGLGSGGLNDKQIEKIAKLAANPFAQPDVRKEQMMKLIHDGSEAAIKGLLQRFSVNSTQAIADEEEKRFLVDELVHMGDKAVPPLKEYLRKETALSFAAEALMGILPKDQAVTELLSLLDVYGPDDYRADEQKRQLMHILSEEDDERVLASLAPYILDHSDDVRHQVLELFQTRAQAKDKNASTVEVLASISTLLRDQETSPRIARKAAEMVTNLEWQLPGDGALNAVLDSEFFIDKKGYVRRRAAKLDAK
jgi:hypothetical protein